MEPFRNYIVVLAQKDTIKGKQEKNSKVKQRETVCVLQVDGKLG